MSSVLGIVLWSLGPLIHVEDAHALTRYDKVVAKAQELTIYIYIISFGIQMIKFDTDFDWSQELEVAVLQGGGFYAHVLQ